ncbi:MAG: EamA family transporter [Alphaproteobacteria bacterium]|jgi:drug/metabolite transporter (DMT)-like permease|nr:EamA family transporter [Alphaproteobacteria bacterium]MBT4017668.1 EamA family transporter [Alphaproteobacteria bacterium]MBT4964800.1 EamA family transporter [Alphaproteobacteria bacterium]MBT5162126.1 EamA family transporter [Alphaproteobacteria bacterium]MBT5919410.1 EamA family transporter [Alphaproteobacteria bacterium]
MKLSGNLMGIVLMTLAMLLIPTVDGLAKYLSGQHSPLYIGWARYAVASMVVLPFAVFSHGKRIFPQNNLGPHILRTIFLMSAMTLFFLAIARTPLATAISAYFVAPIIAALLAVIFLKERLTTIKTVAVVLGFSGALIILRPGMDMDIGVLLAMGAGAFFAFYVITTRQASRQSDPIRTLVFQCVVGTLILTPQAIWAWSLPAVQDLHLFLTMGCLSALSHILSITAFRYAEASTLAPLVYLELVSASIIGYIFFDDLPDVGIWIGAAVIVASGLLLLKSPINKDAKQSEIS